jgi:hypothetical protein
MTIINPGGHPLHLKSFLELEGEGTPYWPDAGIDMSTVYATGSSTSFADFASTDLVSPPCPLGAPEPMFFPNTFEPTHFIGIEAPPPPLPLDDEQLDQTRPHPHLSNQPLAGDSAPSARARTNHACEPCRMRKTKVRTAGPSYAIRPSAH